MRQPMQFELAAARYVLGQLPAWDIPRLASELIDGGYYSVSLTRMVGWPHPRMAQIAHAFEAAVSECGFQLPSRTDAVLLLARHTAQQIDDGTLGACAGAQQINAMLSLKTAIPDSLRPFVELAEICEHRDARTRDAHETRIRCAATSLLESA